MPFYLLWSAILHISDHLKLSHISLLLFLFFNYFFSESFKNTSWYFYWEFIKFINLGSIDCFMCRVYVSKNMACLSLFFVLIFYLHRDYTYFLIVFLDIFFSFVAVVIGSFISLHLLLITSCPVYQFNILPPCLIYHL